jgi:hypothetical protein
MRKDRLDSAAVGRSRRMIRRGCFEIYRMRPIRTEKQTHRSEFRLAANDPKRTFWLCLGQSGACNFCEQV